MLKYSQIDVLLFFFLFFYQYDISHFISNKMIIIIATSIDTFPHFDEYYKR